LVLGGAGFLGTHLCRMLCANHYEVLVYDRNITQISWGKKENPKIDFINGNFSSETDFFSLLNGIDIVFHLISTTNPSNQDLLFDFESNVLPTIRLLNACVGKKVRKVIYFSSGGTVYGIPQYIPIDECHFTEPISSYGIHKLAVDKCLGYYGRTYGLNYNIIRISNPYGENQNPASKQGVIAVFLARILAKQSIEVWGDGNVIRDYIYIQDVMDACIKLIEYRGKYKIFNIGSGKGYSLNELLHILQRKVGRIFEVEYLKGRLQDVPVNILDIDLARKELGWSPKVDIETGIEKMITSWNPRDQEFERNAE